jgi:hypothetical protein
MNANLFLAQMNNISTFKTGILYIKLVNFGKYAVVAGAPIFALR